MMCARFRCVGDVRPLKRQDNRAGPCVDCTRSGDRRVAGNGVDSRLPRNGTRSTLSATNQRLRALGSWRTTVRGSTMAWTTPTLVEICVGLEINGYLPAEF